jgi:hypothetical protein
MKGKSCECCISLPCACEKHFADDLLQPGIVLARVTPASKKEVTVSIIEMKSIHQLEKAAPTSSLNKTLDIQAFQSPSTVAVGSSGETTQQAKVLSILFDMVLSLADDMMEIGVFATCTNRVQNAPEKNATCVHAAVRLLDKCHFLTWNCWRKRRTNVQLSRNDFTCLTSSPCALPSKISTWFFFWFETSNIYLMEVCPTNCWCTFRRF